MALTQKEADDLLLSEKRIILADEVIKSETPQDFLIKQQFPLRERFTLEDDMKRKYLLNIDQSSRNRLKLTLHHQEKGGSEGLLRVDYGGKHRNPTDVLASVPERLRQYAGEIFRPDTPHIHFFVEGYPGLKWAIPLASDDFPIKEIREETEADDVKQSVQVFAKRIHLLNQILFNSRII